MTRPPEQESVIVVVPSSNMANPARGGFHGVGRVVPALAVGDYSGPVRRDLEVVRTWFHPVLEPHARGITRVPDPVPGLR